MQQIDYTNHLTIVHGNGLVSRYHMDSFLLEVLYSEPTNRPYMLSYYSLLHPFVESCFNHELGLVGRGTEGYLHIEVAGVTIHSHMLSYYFLLRILCHIVKG